MNQFLDAKEFQVPRDLDSWQDISDRAYGRYWVGLAREQYADEGVSLEMLQLMLPELMAMTFEEEEVEMNEVKKEIRISARLDPAVWLRFKAKLAEAAKEQRLRCYIQDFITLAVMDFLEGDYDPWSPGSIRSLRRHDFSSRHRLDADAQEENHDR